MEAAAMTSLAVATEVVAENLIALCATQPMDPRLRRAIQREVRKLHHIADVSHRVMPFRVNMDATPAPALIRVHPELAA